MDVGEGSDQSLDLQLCWIHRHGLSLEVFAHTVNSELFAGILFSRNFAYAKFREIKPWQSGEIIMPFTDIGKSCPSREFFYVANMSFNAIRENKIRKIPNLQYAISTEFSFTFMLEPIIGQKRF